MRIIAGIHRGRRIEAPPGRGTRPMLDRVREAIFASLGARLDDARVLDLYAGSGSIGLEAHSRGARFVRFVESAPKVVQVLRGNLAALGLEGADEVEVRRGRALDEACWSPPVGAPAERWADLVLVDPPYPAWSERRERERLLAAIATLVDRVLRADGMLVLHAPRRALESRELSGLGANLSVDERQYGGSSIWYVAQLAESDAAEASGSSAATRPPMSEPTSRPIHDPEPPEVGP